MIERSPLRKHSVKNVSNGSCVENGPGAFDELGDIQNPLLRLFLPRLGAFVVILGFRRDRSRQEGAKLGVLGVNLVLLDQPSKHDRSVLMSCRSAAEKTHAERVVRLDEGVDRLGDRKVKRARPLAVFARVNFAASSQLSASSRSFIQDLSRPERVAQLAP